MRSLIQHLQEGQTIIKTGLENKIMDLIKLYNCDTCNGYPATAAYLAMRRLTIWLIKGNSKFKTTLRLTSKQPRTSQDSTSSQIYGVPAMCIVANHRGSDLPPSETKKPTWADAKDGCWHNYDATRSPRSCAPIYTQLGQLTPTSAKPVARAQIIWSTS